MTRAIAGSAAAPTSSRPSAYDGFVSAAARAVRHLHAVLGLDLWLVTWLDVGPRSTLSEPLLTRLGLEQQTRDQQVVVAAAGPKADRVPAGVGLDWSTSFCRHLIEEGAPSVASDVRDVPAYAALVDPARSYGLGEVRVYVGAPIRRHDGTVLGTVCGYGFAEGGASAQPSPAGLTDGGQLTEEHLSFTAALLASVVGGEQRGLRRAAELKAAVAAAERDAATGLRDRRGWDSAVAYEHQRVLRYGNPASVVVLRVNGGGPDDRGETRASMTEAAELVVRTCRPGDVVARTGERELSVLAVEADILAVSALASRLHSELRSAGVRARIGLATRRTGEDLRATTRRAGDALLASRGRRRRRGPRLTTAD